MPSILDAYIQNVPSSASTDNLPSDITVSSGSNRWLLVWVLGSNGVDVVDPTGASWGGQAMTLIDQSVAEGSDVLVQLYGLNEAGIAAASGTAFSLTQIGAGTFGAVSLTIQGASQDAPVSASAFGDGSTASGSVSLTRQAGALTLFASMSDSGFDTLTLTNPAASGGYYVTNAAEIRYGDQIELTANTSDSTWSKTGGDRENASVVVSFASAGSTQPSTETFNSTNSSILGAQNMVITTSNVPDPVTSWTAKVGTQNGTNIELTAVGRSGNDFTVHVPTDLSPLANPTDFTGVNHDVWIEYTE